MIRLLMENPQEGLREAIDQYGAVVHWIAANIIGTKHRQDVEECVSDVFTRLWKNIKNFEKTRDSKLSSYIYGIARHTAFDYRRKKSRVVESIPFEENDLQMELDYVSEFARKKNAQIIQEVIDGLPQPERDIFIYRYYFKWKVIKISEHLGLKPKQVENKLYRGKDMIKKRLVEGGIIL